MSREYPPLTRKKQKIKDGREWVVAKYSYIYAIVLFIIFLISPKKSIGNSGRGADIKTSFKINRGEVHLLEKSG